jgi:hypothetical protein
MPSPPYLVNKGKATTFHTEIRKLTREVIITAALADDTMGMERFFIHVVGRRRYIEERDRKQIRVDKGG